MPSFASGALPLLGETFGCSRRFNTFLRPTLAPTCDPESPFRTLDGTCNNLNNDLWGAAFTKFRRLLPQAYGEGLDDHLAIKSSDQYTMDYDDELEASIANSFATAAYRFGHSQIAVSRKIFRWEVWRSFIFYIIF